MWNFAAQSVFFWAWLWFWACLSLSQKFNGLCVRQGLDFEKNTAIKLCYHNLIFAEFLNVRVMFLVQEQTVVGRPRSVSKNIAQTHPLKIFDPVIFHVMIDVPNKDRAADVFEGQGPVVAQSVQNLSKHLC